MIGRLIGVSVMNYFHAYNNDRAQSNYGDDAQVVKVRQGEPSAFSLITQQRLCPGLSL